ncbi:N-acetylmuramic acid 6-phosphate etherase [Streptomyces sp. 1114.5]|uniref:N-acetylmuramic acid 6-phosphate etherase n=1 Tax=Streptomyces sp. 1114.5 TaxID=1938830 RepID=UPI000EB106F9|nr:N-acetylmuramic acid 6-phosphate etherase [Streptomyces sp. 1114.5]RKT19750.1 N-acetylmuramic acid 6-phosphate etherase [Streptomyces sp. 1114.5]
MNQPATTPHTPGSGRAPDAAPVPPTERIRPDWAAIDQLPTPELLRLMNAEDRAVPAAVAGQLERIAAVVDAVAARMARGGRLVYAGAGSAGRLGVLDAAECPPTFGTDPALVVGLIAGGRTAVTEAVEGAEDRSDLAEADVAALGLTAADTLVGVSASGRTPYAVAAVRAARATGALTVGLACNRGSALVAAAELGIEVEVGPEVLAGSTRLKAGTAQKLVLNMLSTAVMVRLGRTYGNLMVDVRATNAKLRERARRIVAEATGADEEAVRHALTATDGRAKEAVLVLLADVDAPTAARLLTAADGHLRDALHATRDTTPHPSPHEAPRTAPRTADGR